MTSPRPSSAPRASIFRPRVLAVLAGLWWCALCLAPWTAGAGSAPQPHQRPYALIYGTVWGPDNRALYGVPVKIRRAGEKKIRWELYSDHQGEFAQRVPPGPADYLVTADLKGYKYLGGKRLRLNEEVKVHVDNEERQDIGLHLRD